MGKDTTAFKERFNDYKNGKPVSEIYDAGLPRYAGGKRGYIGGSTKHARETVWNTDQTLSNAVDSIANAYLLKDGLLLHRLNEEGFTDKAIRLYNNAGNQSLYTGENLLNNKTDFSGVGDFGLDDAGTMILNNQMLLKGEKWWDEEGENEQGRITHGAVGDTVRDTIGLQASALKYFSDQVKKDYPNLSDYDNARYAQAYYQRGVGGGRKWAKAGAKGYNFSTKPLAMRPAETPYLLLTTIQSTAAPKFGKYANGKLPLFRGGKIGHNVSHAKLNEDGTFTDDYTKVFEDMYVTPQNTDLKRGSYTLNNFPYYLQHRTDWMKPFMSSGTNEKGLEQPTIDPFLIGLTGGRISGDLIGDAIGLGAEKALLLAATTAARAAAKTKVGKRTVETIMRTSSNPTPFDKLKNGIKTFDKKRTKAVLNYILTGKRNGELGYYNSFAEHPDLAYTGFVNDKLKKIVDDLDEANIMLHNPESEYGDAIDAYLYNKQIDPVYGFDLKSVGNDFGPHDLYIALNYKKVSKNIPVYLSPVLTLEIKIPDLLAYKVNPIKVVGDEGYIRGNYSKNGFVEYDSAGHLKLLGSFTNVPVSRELDIWKYLPSDYSKYATDLHGIKKFLLIIGTNAVDAAGTPIIVRTPWLYDPKYSKEFIENFPGYSNGKSPIHIKPANRGKFTALKKRTGHSASWFKENGTPEQKKMAIFALNAKKWKH